MDEARARYLRDRVMTATPAQRVVMLYDRLALDLTLAASADDLAVIGGHISHASQVVAELLGSLKLDAGGPAENLAALYGYLLRELTGIRVEGAYERLPELSTIVTRLRAAWATVAQESLSAATTSPRSGAALAGAWVS
jgi:flagellar secretion chaperone FliS